MARPYSNDLRTRVVAAVKTEGLPRHQAASRYGVAISTAINWESALRIGAVCRLIGDRVEAPWLLDGPINGQSFLLNVEQVLVPTLKPGDIVIMDMCGHPVIAGWRN